MSAAVIPDLCNGQRRLILVTFIVSSPVHFTFLLQRLLGLGDLGFPASHYPECRPSAVFCLSLIPDITLELITMLLAPDLTSLINSP